MSEIHLAKVASIQRAVKRAREEFAAAGERFAQDYTRQDAAVLNVLRACETALDLANLLIREQQLGIPQSNRESFKLLVEGRILPAELGVRLQKMVGFRNVAVHQYRELDMSILTSILQRDLDDLLSFSEIVATS